MIPANYWKREDTPMKNSPAGTAMQRVAELYPELTVDECLGRAREALDRAAGCKRYNIQIETPLRAERWKKLNEVRAKKAKTIATPVLETRN